MPEFPAIDRTLHILLIEDNPSDAALIKEALRDTTGFSVTWVDQFSDALVCIDERRFDLILLDLTLPDSYGLWTATRACREIPGLPIVVLTGMNDEVLGAEAVQAGAQDYLVKGQVDTERIIRALRYAVTRHAKQEKVKASSMTDELTGLSNRRGFLMLAEQQMKMAQRTDSALLLCYADIDNLKWINDTWGHREGDRAITAAADAFRKTFRESDVIARLGGDEFAVAVLQSVSVSAETLAARLQQGLDDHNAQTDRPYKLVMSIGTAQHTPTKVVGFAELLNQADAAMYVQKRSRKERCLPMAA